MSFSKKFERIFRLLLPSPFTIAVVLTLFTMLLALVFGHFPEKESRLVELLDFWLQGIWNPPLLVFAIQMMLILVLGHSLALAPPISKLIEKIITYATTPFKAVFLVTVSTMVLAFFNWGLGLIFGAILARKTAEKFSREGKNINYPLLGAAGYSGMMVWHGGISGSAPIKVVENGHLQNLMSGVLSAEKLHSLPASIPFVETIFSPMNLTASLLILIILPLALALLASKSRASLKLAFSDNKPSVASKTYIHEGAEKLDHSRLFCILFALIILGYSLYVPFREANDFGFITLNYLNFTLLGLCLLFHGTFQRFLNALDEAISGASGILIQFPSILGLWVLCAPVV